MYKSIKGLLSNAIKFHRKRRKQICICNGRGKEGAYVIFRSARVDPLHAFMRKGFHHTSILYFDAANKGCGILINMGLNKLAVEVLTYDDVISLINKVNRTSGCVLFGKIAPINVVNQRLPSFEPYNCVAICKRLLGIKKQLIWTPYQLYKALVDKYNFRRVYMGGGPSQEQENELAKQQALTQQLQQQQEDENKKDEDQKTKRLREEQGFGGFNMPGSGNQTLG